jgi:tetratricopeptide (TPR) repeat protein
MLASAMRKSILLTFAFLLTIPSTALAQQPSKQEVVNKQEAAKHFKTGQDAYNKADYPTAVKEFVSAYQIAPYNDLLLNIGQAYRLSGDTEKALAYYEKYVEFEPNGAQVADAKKHITEIKENLATAQHEQELKAEEAARAKAEADARAAEDAKTKSANDVRARAEAENAGKGLRIGGLVVGIAGVAAAGVGIAVAAGSSTGAGIGIAAGGGAMIVGGTVMYLIGRGQQRDALAKVGQTSMIVPAVAPGFYGAAWVGSF